MHVLRELVERKCRLRLRFKKYILTPGYSLQFVFHRVPPAYFISIHTKNIHPHDRHFSESTPLVYCIPYNDMDWLHNFHALTIESTLKRDHLQATLHRQGSFRFNSVTFPTRFSQQHLETHVFLLAYFEDGF